MCNRILPITDTPLTDIEDRLKKFIKRDDIDIILINQNVSRNYVAPCNDRLAVNTFFLS